MNAGKPKSQPTINLLNGMSTPSVPALLQNLHDTVAQNLTAAGMLAHVVAERLEQEHHVEAKLAQEVAERVNAASTELRQLVTEYADARREVLSVGKEGAAPTEAT